MPVSHVLSVPQATSAPPTVQLAMRGDCSKRTKCGYLVIGSDRGNLDDLGCSTNGHREIAEPAPSLSLRQAQSSDGFDRLRRPRDDTLRDAFALVP